VRKTGKKAEEWVTFRRDAAGSVTEHRAGLTVEHGVDRRTWPRYVRALVDRMREDDFPASLSKRVWAVKVAELELKPE
jgi:hypothetical protein